MPKQNLFPTQKVIAIAVAAFEFNKNTIIRDSGEMDGVKQFSNRELIMSYLNGETIPFTVTDFHITQAEELMNYLQQVSVMQTLQSGSIFGFLENIIKSFSSSTVKNRDIGILAWVPKLAEDYRKKDQIREVSAKYELNSRYVGKIGDKIIITFNLIESRYVKTLDCFSVYGTDGNGNLIFYWAKDKNKIVDNVRIQGRVKNQQKDTRRGNAFVTTINYVKVL
jgi:hypothetical protein